MATGVASWSTTAATNATADSNVNWAEGMAPSAVNNSSRAEMASVAMYRDDIEGSLTTGGTATQYTLTTTQSFASLSALDGNMLAAKFHLANGSGATLNVDGLGAKALQTAVGTNVGGGSIPANSVQRITYDNANNCFLLNDSRSGAVNLADLNVSGAGSVATPAADDLIVLFDSSAASNLNITVNNFFRAINVLTEETALQSTDVLPLYDMSASTGDKVTISNLFATIGALGEETAVASNDALLVYDASASTGDKMTFSNAFKAVNVMAEETAVASTDEFLVYDVSASTADKTTFANIIKATNTLASVTVDSVNDFLPIYDSSGAVGAKVAPTNLGIVTAAAGAAMALLQTHSINNVASVVFTNATATAAFDGTYDELQLHITNLSASATGDLWIRAATGDPATFDTGASAYSWQRLTLASNGTLASTVDSLDSQMAVVLQMSSTDGHTTNMEFILSNPQNNQQFSISGRGTARTGAVNMQLLTGGVYSAVTSVTGISVLNGSGTFRSGRISLFGVKKS